MSVSKLLYSDFAELLEKMATLHKSQLLSTMYSVNSFTRQNMKTCTVFTISYFNDQCVCQLSSG